MPYLTSSNDFRSDTFTTPTKEMFEVVSSSSIGDAVYDEDVDTLQLQQKVAEIFGKEAGLFCVSGTLSNQLALRTHLLQPPSSILCDFRGHIYVHEAGGLATLSQSMVTPVIPCNGKYLTVEDIAKWYIPDDGDIHAAPTRIVSLENTLHGIIYPIDELLKIKQFCVENDLKLHCDGARLWNAVVASKITDPTIYGKIFDSISICLSKSMGAPIGSVLIGDKAFIKKANHFRKQQGGGIRQSGILCKMAMVAIESDWHKNLQYSHDLAHDFAKYCENLGIPLECPCDTNFVFLDLEKCGIDPIFLSTIGEEKYNVRLMGNRVTFHYQISRKSVENLKLAIKEAVEYAKEHPFKGSNANKIYRAIEK
ncbi:probable Low-specificity L-threonine aldolase [Saccharomycodes ludwigii]|uniref:low-specificity L-threonine aldolase n=1 Tax=Saccharomycodes ludwigii TaxID=36035 RepID=A0A376BB95_9ASCO|nr:hypothetical protein SCDLUD_001349 [Saccharomycodes ludwigii]KAH3901586.1 hypothetical protein SCDLUD_001349 [Saccharomycodes ludwigii]SSD61952.1 probable Low-specificity L-threonine aldolase [Saccharomycodes ludwigii]